MIDGDETQRKASLYVFPIVLGLSVVATSVLELSSTGTTLLAFVPTLAFVAVLLADFVDEHDSDQDDVGIEDRTAATDGGPSGEVDR